MAQIPLGGSIGVQGSAFVLGSVNVVMPADMDYMMSAVEFSNFNLVVTSSVSLTTTRKIVAPLNPGQTYYVTNNTTGGQAIKIIGATGSGFSIPNGQTSLVSTNGVNYASSGSGGGGGGIIVFNPDVPSSGNTYQTAAEIAAIINQNNGAVTLYIDGATNTATIPNGITWNFQGNGTMLGINSFSNGLLIQEGGVILNPPTIINLIISIAPTATDPFQWSYWDLTGIPNYLNLFDCYFIRNPGSTHQISTVPPLATLGLIAELNLNNLIEDNGTGALFALTPGTGGQFSGGTLSTFFSQVTVNTWGAPNFVSGDATCTLNWVSDAAGYPIPTFPLFSTGLVQNVGRFPDAAAGVRYDDSLILPALIDGGSNNEVQKAIDILKSTARGATIVPFAFSDTSPKVLQTMPGKTSIVQTTVQITIPFNDPTASIEFGVTATPTAILGPSDVALGVTGQTTNTAVYVQGNSPDTLILTISPGASTVGGGILYYWFQ